MIEQDAITGEDPVGFTVIDGVPMCGTLGDSVRGSGVEGCRFRLWGRGGSEHLRRSGLVVTDVGSSGS